MRSISTPINLVIANTLFAEAAIYGGAARNNNLEKPTEGFLVSVKSGITYPTVTDINAHEVSELISKQWGYAGVNGLYFRSWRLNEKGFIHFDIAKRFDTLNEARDCARAHDQKTYWDIKLNKEILITV